MYVFNHALTDVFCIIIFLLLIIYFNRSLAVLSEVDTFHNMIASAIIYGISDILCLFGDNGYFRMSADLNFILSVTFLISFALTAYFRTVFITGRLRFEYVQNRLYKVLLVIPVVVSSLLCIGSFGTGLVFYINEANVYSTGPLYHVYAICLNIYNVLLLIEFIIVFVKGDQYRGKKEKLILLSFFYTAYYCGYYTDIYSRKSCHSDEHCVSVDHALRKHAEQRYFNRFAYGLGEQKKCG